MPPGPFSPREHVPAGHVPAVNDGFILVEPPQPQTDDAITRQDGGLFTLQGRVTDEAGNLLAGICVRVDHPAFGEVVTGNDGAFRFVVDPATLEEPALGFVWELWDCVPGGSPDYANVRTSIGHIAPGDTSTWFWRLLAASRLDATVVDRATGLPVPGICLTAFRSARTVQPPLVSAPSGPDGRIVLHGVAPWDLNVTAAPCSGGAWQTWSQTLPFRPGYTVVQRIELDPA